MMQSIRFCASILAGGMMLLSSPGWAQDIEWNYNNKALLQDNGCDSLLGDTYFTSAGNQFSITFKRMNLEMTNSNILSTYLNCTGQIPVRVRGGIVVEKVKQTLAFSWSKNKGSTGGFYADNSWFGQSLGVMRKNLAWVSQGTQPFEAIESETPVDWPCSTQDWVYGSLDTRFMLLGLREQASESLNLNLDGQDLKYSVQVFTGPGC